MFVSLASIIASLIVMGSSYSVAGYNKYKYDVFTPSISVKTKKCYNSIKERYERIIYSYFADDSENVNMDIKAMKEEIKKQYGEKKLKELEKEIDEFITIKSKDATKYVKEKYEKIIHSYFKEKSEKIVYNYFKERYEKIIYSYFIDDSKNSDVNIKAMKEKVKK